MNRRLSFALLLVGLLSVNPAIAYDAYNNYGPGDTYDLTTGYTVNGTEMEPPLFLPPHIVGSRFRSEATGILAVIRISLHDIFLTGFNQVDIRLHEDAGGTLGPIMEAFTRGPLPPDGPYSSPESITSFDPDVILYEGMNYWLVVAPGDSTTEAVWNWGAFGGDTVADSFNGGLSYSYHEGRQGAMRIEVISIPEPGTLSLLFLGIAMALFRNRHNR